MSIRYSVLLALACLVAAAGVAHANARLTNVTSVDGCVAGPDGNSVQFWEVQPGKTYKLTIIGATDCANAGMDPTLNVRVNSSSVGNTDLVATRVVGGDPGEYECTFPIPPGALCTMPIFYCTTPGQSNTGERVLRVDPDEKFQAHLRMATFGVNCSDPASACETTPTRSRTWAQVKQFYR